MSDFLSFENFITPRIIRIVYALGLLVIAIIALVRIVMGVIALNIVEGIILPLIFLVIAAVLWRVYCEVILVFFDMRDKLAEIAKKP